MPSSGLVWPQPRSALGAMLPVAQEVALRSGPALVGRVGFGVVAFAHANGYYPTIDIPGGYYP